MKRNENIESKIDRIVTESIKKVITDKDKSMLSEGSTMAERQRYYKSKLVRASNVNEDVMRRFFGLQNNRCKPIIVEKITLDRILNKHGENGFIAISANRNENSPEENEQATQSLCRDIIANGYSYLPTYGSYRNNETGEEDDYEPSFIVFNYSDQGQTRDFEELFRLAIKWCGQFNQDDVMVKAPNDIARYFTKDGVEDTNYRYNSSIFKNDPNREYFTSLKDQPSVDKETDEKLWGIYRRETRKNGKTPNRKDFEHWKQTNGQKLNFIGRRWSNDIEWVGECLVNPVPCTLMEGRLRRSRGEIMLY